MVVKRAPRRFKATAQAVVASSSAKSGGPPRPNVGVTLPGGCTRRRRAASPWQVHGVGPGSLVDGRAENVDEAQAIEGVCGEKRVGARIGKVGLAVVVLLQDVADRGHEALLLVGTAPRDHLERAAARVGEVKAEEGGSDAPLGHANGRLDRHHVLCDHRVQWGRTIWKPFSRSSPMLRPVARARALRIVVAKDTGRKERRAAAADREAGLLHFLKVGGAVRRRGPVPEEAEPRFVVWLCGSATAEDEDDVQAFPIDQAREQIGGDAEDELLATRELGLFTPRVRLVIMAAAAAR